MSPPSVNLDTTFERLLQELPVDYWPLAIEFKAFCRARKIKSPALLQVVLCYCGIDQVLRETAGTFTLLEERLSDTAIHKRLRVCLLWVKALLEPMMGAAAAPLIHGHLHFIMVDGSTIQGPGAEGTWYRLPIAVDRVKLHLLHVTVTDKHPGEHLGYYPLQEGDVVVLDRGYHQAPMWIERADQGVSLVVRYNPHRLKVYDADGNQIDLDEALKATAATERCLPVPVRAPGEFIEGDVHAGRLPPAKAAAARRRVRAAAKKKGRTVRARTLRLAEGVLNLYHPATGAVAHGDPRRALPGTLASGTGHKKTQKLARYRPTAGSRTQSFSGAVLTWPAALYLGPRKARPTPLRRALEPVGSTAPRHTLAGISANLKIELIYYSSLPLGMSRSID